MGYALHFVLDDFIDQIALWDQPTTVYLQDLVKTVSEITTSQLILTAQDDSGTVHISRIIVEHTSLADGDRNTIRATVRDRAATAHDLVIDALPQQFTIAHGIVSVPGLLADMYSVQTEHDLWQWERTTDAQTRRLVPTIRPHTARATFEQVQQAMMRVDASLCARLDGAALTWLVTRSEDIRHWVTAEHQCRFRALANDGQ